MLARKLLESINRKIYICHPCQQMIANVDKNMANLIKEVEECGLDCPY